MIEIWKPVTRFEGLYEVSDLGNVRSIRSGNLLKQHNNRGYRFVTFCKEGKQKSVKVHRVVAEVFIGYQNLHVDHLNGIKHDNRLENLQYVTNRENAIRYSASRNRGLPVGVLLFKKTNKYRALIEIDGKSVHLGLFITPEEASAAYQKALSKLVGNN